MEKNRTQTNCLDRITMHRRNMKTRSLKAILLSLAALVSISSCGQEPVIPQDGDVVFQESKSRQSPIIKLAQHCRWTHCGIVFHIGEKAYVYEAVEPVKYTLLEDWIARGKNGEYCVKRLKSPLSDTAIKKMKTVGAKYKGKHYDTLFQWSDNKLYCSELVWKIYSQGAGIELCRPEQFSDFPIDNPIVKKLIKERYGNKLDSAEQIVSPKALYKSKLLEDVHYLGL